MEENVEILENIVEEDKVIIHNLKQDLAATTSINVACKKCTGEEDDSHIDGENRETTSNKTEFKCDICAFVGVNFCDLNMHVKEQHAGEEIGATSFSRHNPNFGSCENDIEKETTLRIH